MVIRYLKLLLTIQKIITFLGISLSFSQLVSRRSSVLFKKALKNSQNYNLTRIQENVLPP